MLTHLNAAQTHDFSAICLLFFFLFFIAQGYLRSGLERLFKVAPSTDLLGSLNAAILALLVDAAVLTALLWLTLTGSKPLVLTLAAAALYELALLAWVKLRSRQRRHRHLAAAGN